MLHVMKSNKAVLDISKIMRIYDSVEAKTRTSEPYLSMFKEYKMYREQDFQRLSRFFPVEMLQQMSHVHESICYCYKIIIKEI